MKQATMKDYYNDLEQFIRNHDGDYNVETSSLVNDKYSKMYLFEDGATFWEINDIVYEQTEVEVKGIIFKVEVKMYKIEYWSTDDATSKFVYYK